MIHAHYVFFIIMKLNKSHICKYCGKEFDKGVQLGGHIRLCPNNPKYKENFQKCCMEHNGWRGKHHTEEQKRKVSESRKKYLLEHPEKVPYVLNHHSKGDSYPEKYFKDVFDNAEIDYSQNYYSNGYFLDFAWPDIKIYIEIDGEQHYVDHRIVEHDKIRTQRLHDLGWRLLKRIRWSEFQKLKQSEKENLVYRLLQTIKIQKQGLTT